MKDALKCPVGSSVKCLEVIYTNLHFLPTKILSLLTYKNLYSFSLERIPFSCQSIANVFSLSSKICCKPRLYSECWERTTLVKKVANIRSSCTLKSVVSFSQMMYCCYRELKSLSFLDSNICRWEKHKQVGWQIGIYFLLNWVLACFAF